MKNQTIIMTILLVILTGALFCASGRQTWQECGGYVVMEAEGTGSPVGEWEEKTSVVNYTGSAHLEFTGNGINGGDPTSPLEYHFRITNGGEYRIGLRAYKRLEGEESDKCNDAYVRVEGDYSSASGSVTDGALKNDCKQYIHGNSHNEWDWGNHLDCGGGDHTPAVYNFKSNNDYKLVISGRSIRYNLDRIVFYTSDAESAAKNTSTGQTLTCGNVETIYSDGIQNQGVTVMYSPFNREVTVTFHKASGTDVDARLFDVHGRLMDHRPAVSSGQGPISVTWDGSAFASGVYFFSINNGSSLYRQKVVLHP